MATILHKSTGSFKKLTGNVVSLFIVQISNYALPLLSIPYFTRIVGPEKFGIINFVGAFVGYCILLTSFGFDTTATRDVVQAREDQSKLNQLCSEVIASKALLLVVSLIGYALLVISLPQLRHEMFVSVTSVLICFSIVLIPSWLYQGFQDNHLLAYYNIASKALFTLAILTLVRAESDYILYPLFLSASQVLIGLVAFRQMFRKYAISLKWVTFKDVRQRLQSSQSIFISFVVISLYSTSNIIIIGLFRNEVEVGQLSAALKVMVLIQACISVPFTQALFPYIGQQFTLSREEGIRIVQLAFPVVLAIGIVCCLGGSILAPFIIGLIYGNQFSDAAAMLRVLAFIPLIVIFSQFLGMQIMVNLNMDRTFRKVIIYGAMVGLVLNLIGGYFWGAIGISFTYLFTEILVAGLFVYFLSKENITLSMLLVRFNWRSLLELYHFIKNRRKAVQVEEGTP